MSYPPFSITTEAVNLLSKLMQIIGNYEGLLVPAPQVKLRKQNQLKTIHGSLVIEGNSLSLEQMTLILDKKRVLGPKKDVLEVKNAIEVYSQMNKFKPTRETDFLRAHKVLLNELVRHAGSYRDKDVGVLQGKKVAHIAPPAKFVPKSMKELFAFLYATDVHPVFQSAIFHYEVEFIHPFIDGNGRMGRLWQHLILAKFHKIFDFIPMESMIQRHQLEYYKVLALCDSLGSSAKFIEFSLRMLIQSLEEFLNELKPLKQTVEDRLNLALEKLKGVKFRRTDYIAVFKNISTATASRDLSAGVIQKRLKVSGTKSQATYRFIK